MLDIDLFALLSDDSKKNLIINFLSILVNNIQY